MAVINPHTTRATGTVLTAAIYNTDHQNHITNANALNAELAGVSGVGANTGIIVSNGAGVISGRALQAVANQTVVTNANGLAGDPSIGIANNPILPGNVSVSGTFTASGGAVTLSPVGANILIQPTTTGTVVINPNTAGAIDKMNIGATTPGTGKFTTLQATGASILAGVTGTTGAFSGAVTAASFGNIVGGTVDVTGQITGSNGTSAVPSFRFASSNSGIFRTTADGGVGFSYAGASKGAFHSTGFTVLAASVSDQLIDPDGPNVGVSLSYAGSIVSYATSGFNNQSGRNGDGTHYNFKRVGVSVGSIAVAGAATSFNTSSDKRLKENFRPFNSGAIIDKLNIGQFDWINHPGLSGYGVLAQDAYKVFPDAITKGKGKEPWMADYSKFIPVLLAEVKDLRRRVAQVID